MKNILLILAIQLCIQCNSQKIETPLQEPSSFVNIDQLIGNWYQTKKSIISKGIVTNLEMQCSGKSFWEISSKNGIHTLIKHFATGKNCDTHVIKTNGLTYKNGILQYIEDDISKSEKLVKLSDKSFKITEQSFTNGDSILIENVYEKK